MNKKLITPDKIEDGMILAETLMRDTGQVLCPINMRLVPKHRELFKSWGIETFNVFLEKDVNEDDEENTNQKDNGETRLEAEELLKKRMKWIPRNKNEKDLMEMGIQSISENYF